MLVLVISHFQKFPIFKQSSEMCLNMSFLAPKLAPHEFHFQIKETKRRQTYFNIF